MKPKQEPCNRGIEELTSACFISANKALLILERLNRAEAQKKVFKDRIVMFRGQAA